MEVLGPIAVRKFALAKKCETHEMHKHNYDHTTVVFRGSLSVIVGDETHGPYAEGESVVIKAGVEHTLKAQEDGTAYWCIFSHRDFDGAVIKNYVGNIEAYA